MTCIVGLVADGAVWMGGDSAAVGGQSVYHRADPKVFQTGEYLLGFTDSFRMGQLLRHSFTPPAIPDGADLMGYMVTLFIDAVRACLQAGGFARKEQEAEQGGCFMVGVRGRLFVVEGDYQVGEETQPYNAIGCGADFAYGALYATETLPPQARVLLALEAATRYSTGVVAPYTILRVPA